MLRRWWPRDGASRPKRLSPAAREAGIYVHEAPDLVALLMQIDIDQYIPPELYQAMAELLAWIYWLENRDEHLTKPA